MRPPRKIPRGLSEDEAAAWARLAATVTRYHPPLGGEEVQVNKAPKTKPIVTETGAPPSVTKSRRPMVPRAPLRQLASSSLPRSAEDQSGLDSHWERRLRAGTLAPEFTLDLHEHSLDAAYQRLLGGLDVARETGARVVLVIAGRERPVHAADRAGSRGAIRAKLLDWLAASRHSSAIAAIRKAHRRHGGEGALYVILKRPH